MYKQAIVAFLLTVFSLGATVQLALACSGSTPVPCTAKYPDGKTYPACCPPQPGGD